MQCDKVTVGIIAEFDQEIHGGLFEGKDLELGQAIASAITKLDPPRYCQVVAQIVESLADWDKFSDRPEYWPGYGRALDDLCFATRQIVEGWEQHDASTGFYVGSD